MSSNQKSKKSKGLELGPLNLSKSQYKPYLNGLANKRTKQNLLMMGPLQNIMFDIPQIEEASQPLILNCVQKLRLKIGRYFEEKSLKSKQQWDFYIKKAEIVQSANSSWTEVETFLLRIISDLFLQWKLTLDNLYKLEKFKEQTLQAQSLSNFNKVLQLTKISDRNNKHCNHYSACNMSKLDFSLNQTSNLPRGNLARTKIAKIDKKSISAINCQQNQAEDTCIMHNQKNVQSNNQQFKITRLQRQIQIYRQKISKAEKQHRQKLQEMQKRIQFEQSMKYNQTLQQKMKYQSQVQNKKFYNDVLLNELKVQNTKNVQLSKQLQKLKKQCSIKKVDTGRNQSLMQYKEMWKMQYQEIRQLNLQIQRINGEKEAEITKNKGLKQKLKELSKSFNYNYNISMDSEKQSQDLNRILKDFRDWLTFFAVPRVSKGMMNNNTFFPEMSLGVQSAKQDYLELLPKDDPTNYRLLRPNFFIYFQSYQTIIMTQKKFPQKKILPPIFYLTLRAILDAMYLHFTYTLDYNQWLSFPQFVISFLQKFEVSLQTSKPVLRKIPCQSQDKISFLLSIFNLQAVNTWQRETFRSFLLQDFTLDEVYFYLDCRDQLLKGSQLNNNFGSFDAITYVRVNIAQQLIKQKLRNYDKQMLQRLKKFINSKKKTKNNRQLVDMNFVLKLLLQVYSIQKLKSQRFFYNNFKCKSGSKISYTEYSAFMSKNFDFLTKGDIAKLYREIYTLGVSHITYKTIHFVCSVKGLFIPLLRNKSFSKFDMSTETKYPKPFEDILFLHLQNSLNNMVSGMEEYGLESIASVGISFNKFLHDCEGNKLQRQTFSVRLLQELQKIIKIRTILAWKNKKSIIYSELTKEQIRQRLGHLLTIINQSDDDFSTRKKWKQARQKAMKKLTRNFKIRIQQSLAEFKILDKKQYQIKIGNNNNEVSNQPLLQPSQQISAFTTPPS